MIVENSIWNQIFKPKLFIFVQRSNFLTLLLIAFQSEFELKKYALTGLQNKGKQFIEVDPSQERIVAGIHYTANLIQ